MRRDDTATLATMELRDPAPRVVLVDAPESVRHDLEGFAGTARFVADGETFHGSDFDLYVSFHENAAVPDFRGHRLVFGATRLRSGGREWWRARDSAASRLVRPSEGIPAPLQRLVDEHLLPKFSTPPRLYWVDQLLWPGSDDGRPTPIPLAVIGQEQEMFAFLQIDEPNRHTLVLPPFNDVFRPWFDAFLDMLREADPDNFPPEPDWINDPTWAPTAVLTALQRIEQRTAERDQMLADANAALSELTDELTAAQDTATNGIRKLLTTQGPELETAVASALGTLGFTVEEQDETHVDTRGRRLEDLKVTLPDTDGWESLVEVKGYTNGAKVNDFAQVTGSPCAAFASTEGRRPTTVWHIVNVWKDQNPATRPDPTYNDVDLVRLLEADGALIDTRDLYRALNDVDAGRATAKDVRQSLTAAQGHWRWPAHPGTPK